MLSLYPYNKTYVGTWIFNRLQPYMNYTANTTQIPDTFTI